MSEQKINRRKAPDKWIYVSRILTIISWFFFIVALVVSYYAAPDERYGLLIYKNIPTRDHWLMPLTNYLYLVLWFSALSSYFCLFLTKYRARRKDDSKQFNLLILLLVIIAWIIYIILSIYQP